LKDTRFFIQAELLLQIIPFFSNVQIFALKGGTAINFFIRNLPRLSVDIDLAYLPVTDREKAIADISMALEKIAELIPQRLFVTQIDRKYLIDSRRTIALLVRKDDASVKIEPNLVVRGAVFPSENRILCKKAETLFEQSVASSTLSFADIYAGKICAALDRQHPRDLFDIKMLLENEGLTDQIRQAFIVYLISHPRPIVELLDPNFIDISQTYENEFRGMTTEDISLKDLIQTRATLVRLIKRSLTINERRFILSVKQREPQWSLLDLEHIRDLPAVKWKLINLGRMNSSKHQKAVKHLREYLEL
jgi:predicted nucleotidyltransferase component of viral defense system